MLQALDRRALAAVFAADRISRRRFIDRATKVGIVVSTGVAATVWGPAPNAAAIFYQDCNFYVHSGQTDYNAGACGPSDECGDVECDGAENGSCNAGHVCDNDIIVKGRDTAGDNSCGPEFYWYECCPNGGFKCTDCCGCKYHPGNTCEEEGGSASCVSPHPHHKCICDHKVADTCHVG